MAVQNGFVYLDEAVPGALWDAKYAGNDNFLGRPADGYRVNRVVCAKELAAALVRAEVLAEQKGLRLFVFDAYRPARAVADFCRWAAQPDDGKRKSVHFPNIDKASLIDLGYIAEKSGHSRGCTVDLTLSTPNGFLLDMGGCFDLMDTRSHLDYPGLSSEQAKNRDTLRGILLPLGFTDYECEWWHFRLKNEPYPDMYFDFPIE